MADAEWLNETRSNLIIQLSITVEFIVSIHNILIPTNNELRTLCEQQK